ncbi:MAG: glycosyltransferase [Chloroflexi bacterium]|nr:MAG: glycosyltransferase [Chloroflexota bacterium]MBL1192830.1 glycosyltransferase [Chloroflexota bacterium]NOH10123.1 glycosyltransferase family 4 protein [Chloroflexota bacterium]
MKVALIAPSRIPARTANSIQTMKMAQAFTRLGHEVAVLVPGSDPQLSWDEIANHYGLDTEFHMQWVPTRMRTRGYGLGLKAYNAARRWGAEVIYTRLPQAAGFSSIRGFPTIFEMHDMPRGRIGPHLFRNFLNNPGAKRLVVITQALADDLADRLGAPSEPPFTLIQPDGIDLERYADLPEPQNARKELGFAEGFTAGYTGHLYKGRGAELLLDMAEGLPDVNFLLVGGEPADVERVRELASSKGLTNVQLTGFVPNAELPQYQAACDVLLMPYQSEVAASSGGDISDYLSPMKMFEYLAAGRAIMTSDLPVLQEVLNEEVAVIVPGDDVEAWVEVLLTLKDSSPKRTALGQNARMLVQQYTWEERAATLLNGIEGG